MDPINHLSKIAEQLRRQAVDTASNAGKRDKTTSGSSALAGSTGRVSVEELQQKIRDRIRNLGNAQSDRKKQATRVFVESVLAWEFGEEISSDPRFYTLVEHVQSAMESDASIGNSIDMMIDKMCAE